MVIEDRAGSIEGMVDFTTSYEALSSSIEEDQAVILIRGTACAGRSSRSRPRSRSRRS